MSVGPGNVEMNDENDVVVLAINLCGWDRSCRPAGCCDG